MLGGLFVPGEILRGLRSLRSWVVSFSDVGENKVAVSQCFGLPRIRE